MIENPGMGTAGTHLCQIMLERLDALQHPAFDVLLQFGNHLNLRNQT